MDLRNTSQGLWKNMFFALIAEMDLVVKNLINLFFITRFLGSEGAAAYEVVMPCVMIASAFVAMGYNGVQAVCAKDYGAKDPDSFERHKNAGYTWLLLVMVALSLLFAAFSDSVLDLLGAGEGSQTLYTLSRDCYHMFLLCFVPSLVLWCLACDPDIPMTPIVAVLLTMLMMALLPKKPLAGIITSAILIPVGYWLLGPAIGLLAIYSLHWLGSDMPKLKVSVSAIALIVLLGLCIWASSWLSPYPLRQLARGVDYYWEGNKAGTYEEMEYDMLIRQQNWTAIAGKYDSKSSESLAVRNSAQLAFYNLQRNSKVDLLERMTLSGQTLKSISSAFLMSEVGLQIGMINVSQRSAFEAMEAIPNHNKSARALRRLVETNIVTRNYEVALKYIAILEKTTFYRSWAQRMRPLAEHPDRIKTHLIYQRLQDAYDKGKDMFFY